MITLTNPMDMHLHLREGQILDSVLPYTAKFFSAGVVMPNLKTPITNIELALAYKKQIIESAKGAFEPIITLFLTSDLSKDMLIKAKGAGIKILKLYPKGSTTQSENGVSDVLCDKTLELFEIAQELGFILSIHGESNGFCMDREFEFLAVFKHIAQNFPKLQTIIEHISDRRSLELIESYPSLYGTLTLHHITMSLDDMLGGSLNPHYFCKPMLKTKLDQQALLKAALSAHPKISFGSDSAPHLESLKLSAKAPGGIFSAPILLSALIEIFEKHNALEHLQNFISQRAITNYGLEHFPRKSLNFKRIKSQIPKSIPTPLGNIIPLWAGKSLAWNLANEEE